LPNVNRYIRALYWACITMSTIGYGDVSPTNDYERVYVMIMCLLSCGIFGYSMSESK
jgi:hypothetical protein